jgi:hypothetical protein
MMAYSVKHDAVSVADFIIVFSFVQLIRQHVS